MEYCGFQKCIQLLVEIRIISAQTTTALHVSIYGISNNRTSNKPDKIYLCILTIQRFSLKLKGIDKLCEELSYIKEM